MYNYVVKTTDLETSRKTLVKGEIMDRKFLEEMGLEKENIDKILDNHHKSLEDYKTDNKTKDETIKTLQEDIKTKEKDLADLSKAGLTAEEYKTKFEELQKKYDDDSKDFSSKLENITFESQLEKAIALSKAKNTRAVKALLDIETLKNSKDRSTDIEVAISALREAEDSSFLFGEVEAKPVDTVDTIGAINGGKPANIGGVEAAFMARNPDLKL